jgi:hypothetical protein
MGIVANWLWAPIPRGSDPANWLVYYTILNINLQSNLLRSGCTVMYYYARIAMFIPAAT